MVNSLVSKYQKLHNINDSQLTSFKSSDGIKIHSGSLFTDFDKFVESLDEAISSKLKIVIHPDYDVDGETGGRVCKTSLDILGAQDVKLYYPKSSDGYGLSITSVDKILELWPDCKYIFTVDNGINVKEAADYAFEKGIKLIVTDHHDAKLKLYPDVAMVTINPKRVDKEDTYPFKGISGTCVAWKLFLAYAEEKGLSREKDLINDLKPLVGISIISDVMPTTNENRRLLRESIDELNDFDALTEKILKQDVPTSYIETFNGLRGLLKYYDETGKCKIGQVTDTTIGFLISPMLNAPRRMEDDSSLAFELFSLDNESTIHKLNALNELRKEEVALASTKFMNQYPAYEISDLHGIVAQADYVRHGIVGLIAGNITNEFKIPSVILSKDYGGSARSPYAYNLEAILTIIEDRHPEYFVSWGGHDQAAGVKIHKEYYEDFKRLFNIECENFLRTVKVDDRVLKEKAITLDAKLLPTIEEVEYAVSVFDSIKPFSFEVPEPKFKISFDYLEAEETYMTNGKHVKFVIKDENGQKIEVIVWGQGEQAKQIDPYKKAIVTVSGQLSLNVWKNYKGVITKTPQITSTLMSIEYIEEEDKK